MWNTAFKRVAVVLAIISMLTGCAMSVPEIREKLVHFFVVRTQVGTNFHSEESRPCESIEYAYKLTDIPEEYELQAYDKSDTVVYSLWQHPDDDNQMICFTQSLYGSNIVVNTENVELSTIDINGNTGYMCTNDGRTVVVWSDEYYEVLFVCSDELDYRALLDSIE